MPQSRRPGRIDIDLPRVTLAYLDERARLGVYGRGKGGVIRRFVEQGIQKALEARVIAPKNVTDFGDDGEEQE